MIIKTSVYNNINYCFKIDVLNLPILFRNACILNAINNGWQGSDALNISERGTLFYYYFS